MLIYWIYPYDIVITTNAHNILIHNGHEATNFILSFTILVFYAHGGEIEFVPLEAKNYRYSTSLFTKIQHDLHFINHHIYAYFFTLFSTHNYVLLYPTKLNNNNFTQDVRSRLRYARNHLSRTSVTFTISNFSKAQNLHGRI